MPLQPRASHRRTRAPSRTAALRGPVRLVRAAGVVLAVAGSAVLLAAAPASASTTGGTATIATPGSQAALGSGGSQTVFTVTLPANAACSGDTATGGYHVYSYLVPKGTSLASLTFINTPSTGYGFVDNTGLYYGAVNTAISTGQIIGIPNDFSWAPLVVDDSVPLSTLLYTGGTTGVWEAGIACADTTGALSDNWNTEVTFAASSSDPNGFTWTAVPGVTTTTTTTTTTAGHGSTTTTTTAGAATTTTTTASAPESTTTTAVAAGPGAGGTGTGGVDPTGSDGSTDSDGSTTGGSLAYTGFPTLKAVGVGLLAVGLGLVLLGWGYRHRRRRGAAPSSPW